VDNILKYSGRHLNDHTLERKKSRQDLCVRPFLEPSVLLDSVVRIGIRGCAKPKVQGVENETQCP
jgi:hypothetical protein